MDVLGRYYTRDVFSDLLINQFSSEKPFNILELGVGGGALIKAASIRWKDANFYAADIDKNSVSKINKELPFVKIINADSLNKNINKKLELKIESVDIAICNPPYLKIENKKEYTELFNEVNLKNCHKISKVTSDIIFLAQNLRLLKNKGELGIILPDSLLTGHAFKILRQSIISEHSIKGVIELPENIFPKTEARTHILLLEKGKPSPSKVSLYIADKSGQCYDQIEVSANLLEQRMDFSFHKWNQKKKTIHKIKTLNELNCEIKRGGLTHSELKLSKRNFIHTTNFKNCTPLTISKDNSIEDLKYVYSKANDILLARVGRGCIGKTSIIKSGRTLISDCVYRLRVPKKYVKQVWLSLISKEGQEWLKANSHGVCAKVISKKDLLNFPVKF